MKAEDLIGTWRLRSFKNVASDGSAVDAFGPEPVGYIFYNQDTVIHHLEVCSFPNWIGNAQVR